MLNKFRRTQGFYGLLIPNSIMWKRQQNERSCRKNQCLYTKGDYETKENKKPSTLTLINFKVACRVKANTTWTTKNNFLPLF